MTARVLLSLVLPFATVWSSGGLILNGVPTPRGVNSALVAPGDVVETVDAPAVARYRDGRVENLAPRTVYTLPKDAGALKATGAKAGSRSGLFRLIPIHVERQPQ
ncbi:MAG: hypothetical protein ABSG26_25890 [Bryobacteraceae bacterium]|jgi:hypothetical protein